MTNLFRTDGRFGLIKAIIDSKKWTRKFLFASIIVGFVLFIPFRDLMYFSLRTNLHFEYKALMLVLFPFFVILFCWLYVDRVAKGFCVVRRKTPEISLENEIIEVNVEVIYSSRMPFAIASMVEDFPATSYLESNETMLRYDNFKKNGRSVVAYRCSLNRGYGNFTIGPTEIMITDPFGFFTRKLSFPIKSQIEVWFNPPFPEDLDLIKENALTPMGDSRSMLSGHGRDFYGIKEYVPGDDVRAMSWLKTAQVGKPIIKQFERDTKPDVFVAIHTDRNQLRGFGFGNTMKRLFRISAAIISETQKAGLLSAFGLCIKDDAHYVRMNPSIPVYGFLTELLSKLEPADKGGLKQIIDMVMRKAGPGSIVIFLSQTVHLDMEYLLGALISMKAKGAKVALWAIDDSDMVRFSEIQQNVLTKEEFEYGMDEAGIEFILIQPKKENSSTE